MADEETLKAFLFLFWMRDVLELGYIQYLRLDEETQRREYAAALKKAIELMMEKYPELRHPLRRMKNMPYDYEIVTGSESSAPELNSSESCL